jgi:Zn-dependent M28 family amino/carboxypeptidase
VDLGYGLPEDIDDEVEGKIAMVRSDTPDDYGRWVHRMEKYGAVVDAGAVGFIFGNHIEGCLPPTGEVGYQNRPAPIPAVGVSGEVAAELRRFVGASTSVELSVDCRNEPATSRNVHAELGPDTEQRVLVSAHIDAHDISQGAIDNGVGSALVVELGRLLAGAVDRLETRVEFVTFGSEEIGLYGSRHYAHTRDCSTVKAVLNLDTVGMSRTPHVRAYDRAMLPPIAAAADDLDVPLSSLDRIDAATDAWPFVVQGVPAVTAGSEKTEAGRGWGHTHGDTLDKIDPRNLRDLAAVFASAVVELADADLALDHRSPETVREQLDEGCVNELHAGGRWPYEPNGGGWSGVGCRSCGDA